MAKVGGVGADGCTCAQAAEIFCPVHSPVDGWEASDNANQPDIYVYRASGECMCITCGKDYLHHPLDTVNVGMNEEPYLHILCNGDRVKL